MSRLIIIELFKPLMLSLFHSQFLTFRCGSLYNSLRLQIDYLFNSTDSFRIPVTFVVHLSVNPTLHEM